jgi:hypothetical protein
MKRYFDDIVAETGKRWNRFWFTPLSAEALLRVRPLVCILAGIWLLTAMANSDWWYGEAGWSASKFAGNLCVAAEGSWSSRFHLSPLWATSSPIVFQIWAGSGAVLAVLAALGIGGRAVMLALCAAVLLLAQRSPWTTGALEPLLIAILAYLVIAPGPALIKSPLIKPTGVEAERRWSSTLATRLIQFHVWLLIAAAFASQLSSLPWWRGDALWWLAVTGRSQLLEPDWLRGHILLINALTHAIVICTGVSVVTLWSRPLRPVGVVCGCALAGAYALLGDQTLYGMLLIAGLLSFWFAPAEE